jgi:hypothetical protein
MKVPHTHAESEMTGAFGRVFDTACAISMQLDQVRRSQLCLPLRACHK